MTTKHSMTAHFNADGTYSTGKRAKDCLKRVPSDAEQTAWQAGVDAGRQMERESAAPRGSAEITLPEKWKECAQRAIRFADSDAVRTHPMTAAAHILGLANLILSAPAAEGVDQPAANCPESRVNACGTGVDLDSAKGAGDVSPQVLDDALAIVQRIADAFDMWGGWSGTKESCNQLRHVLTHASLAWARRNKDYLALADRQQRGGDVPDRDAVELARAGMQLHSPGMPEYIVCAELVRLAEGRAALAANKEVEGDDCGGCGRCTSCISDDYSAPQSSTSIRIGHATTNGGSVQSYSFEQTNLPDGEHALVVGAPQASAELSAWRDRFPQYEYRAIDECVSLKLKSALAAEGVDQTTASRPETRASACGTGVDQDGAKGAGDDGLTSKQSWWAGYRAGKGLPPDTPRQDAVTATLRCFKCGEQGNVSISSAKIVTHWPDGTPRDDRDIASDPEGKLIHDPSAPLIADRQQRGGDFLAALEKLEIARDALMEIADLPDVQADERSTIVSIALTRIENVKARAALAANKPAENIREGYPYDNRDFEDLCREHWIWGTADAALCAVFWRAAIAQQGKEG